MPKKTYKRYICPKCDKVWSFEKGSDYSTICPNCKAEMEYWNDFLTDEIVTAEKEASDDKAITGIVGESKIGKAIKMVAIILSILCLVGSISLCADYGFVIGIAAFMFSGVFLMLLYAAGEVCCLLSSINAKISG